MKTQVISSQLTVNLPSTSDYAQHDPPRASSADGKMAPYWEVIVDASRFPEMLAAVKAGLPPVVAVADDLTELWVRNGGRPTEGRQQFNSWCGAATAFFCEANGLQQSYRNGEKWKQPIGRSGWGRGQMLEAGPATPTVHWK